MNNLLLDCVEIDTPNADKSVIWLHGLGANGHDFVPIIQELNLHAGNNTRFIFPHAPDRAVTINGGMVMPAWYDIFSLEFTSREDDLGIKQSAQQISQLIEREIERGIHPENIVIAGFSQGGAIALQTALRYPRALAGIMVLSSYLPLSNSLASEKSQANQSTHILMCHGIHDPVVPTALGSKSANQLQQEGYPLEWLTYPMEHSVCMDQIHDISAWLSRCLIFKC